MQFPLHEPSVASVLVGTAKPSSLVRNMQLLDEVVPAGTLDKFRPFTITQAPLTGAVRE